MKAVSKKPRGRPRRYIGDRPNWTIRLEQKYGDQIREIAEASGRSISDVCSEQIVKAFRLEFIVEQLETELETSRAAVAGLSERLRESSVAMESTIKRLQVRQLSSKGSRSEIESAVDRAFQKYLGKKGSTP